MTLHEATQILEALNKIVDQLRVAQAIIEKGIKNEQH